MKSITKRLEEIERTGEDYAHEHCYNPDVERLVSALRIAINHLNWLIAKGIVMSSPSSQTPECLENIRKALE